MWSNEGDMVQTHDLCSDTMLNIKSPLISKA
jgi:hypothetical protein